MNSIAKRKDTAHSVGACPSLRKGHVPHVRAARRRSEAKPQGARLENTRTTFPVSKDTRAERWELRDGLRAVTGLKRLKACGKVPFAGYVSLRGGSNGERAGYGGLTTCGSVWACPVCSAKVASRRKDEVSKVIEWAEARGYRVSMLTLTQRHNAGQRLADLWQALSTAWNRVTSGRRWADFKEQLGLVGYIKAVEVTHGANGWHVHVHVLVISEKDPVVTPIFFQRKQGRRRTPYPVEMVRAADFVADRWEAGLAKHGVDFLRTKGMDWHTAEIGDGEELGRYVAKMGTAGVAKGDLAAEATLGGFKKARGENRTPFQIAADLVENGEAEDFAIWREYEEASRGKRALTWSKGLKEKAAIQEISDEEIAAEEVGDDVVLLLDHENWKKVRLHGAVDLLNTLEKKGKRAAKRWCRRREIGFTEPDEARSP